jgi:hypothetical protein
MIAAREARPNPGAEARANPDAGARARPAVPEAAALKFALSVSRPGDPLEQEAHRISTSAVRAPSAGLPPAIALAGYRPVVQRSASPRPGKGAALPVSFLLSINGGGLPLAPGVRADLQSRLGRDLGRVRLHTGDEAGAAATALGAEAFTYGSHIAFAPGRYAPGTASGRGLLAHELVHVAQQGAAPALAPGAVGVAPVVGPVPIQRQASDAAAGGDGSILGTLASGFSAVGSMVSAGVGAATETIASGARSVVSGVERGAEAVAGAVRTGAGAVASEFAAIVTRVAPGLMEMIELGPVEFLGRRIGAALENWLEGVLGPLDLDRAVQSLAEMLGGAVALIEGLVTGDPDACRAFADALDRVRALAHRIYESPAARRVRDALEAVSHVVATVVEAVVAPSFEAAMSVAKFLGGLIVDAGRTIVDWAHRIQAAANAAWDWVAARLGLPSSEEGGLGAWLRQKAVEAWNAIKARLAPIAGPIHAFLEALYQFSPIAQLARTYRLIAAIGWLWEHRNDPDIVASAHAEMGDTILPQLLEGLRDFGQDLDAAERWLSNAANALLATLNHVIDVAASLPILGPVVRAHQRVVAAARGLGGLVVKALTALVAGVKKAASWLWELIEPWKEVLSSLALAVINPTWIPMIVLGWAWRKLPRCMKVPIIDYILDVTATLLEALPEMPMFGPLWGWLRSFLIGFLREAITFEDAVKERVADTLAKVVSGASPGFLFGFVTGFLKGVWDSIADPIKALWEIFVGITHIADWLEGLIRSGQLAGLAARVTEMAADVRSVAGELASGFWDAASGFFAGGTTSLDQVVKWIGDAWGSIRDWLGGAGTAVADKIAAFFTREGSEEDLGDGLGWLTGTIATQVVLDLLTGGEWIEIGPTLELVLRIVNWPVEALGAAFRALAEVGRYVLDAAKAVASIAREAVGTALREMGRLVEELGSKLIRYAEELLERLGLTGEAAALRTAETAEEAAGRLGKGLVGEALASVRQMIEDLIESIREWARQVFEEFGFKGFEIVVEGDEIVLYGISSRVRIIGFRLTTLREEYETSTAKIESLRRGRASLLGRGRAAADDALANSLRASGTQLSGDIGEYAADRAIRMRFGAARRIWWGEGSHTLDLVYEVSDGIVVVEAKGASGRIGTRIIAPGIEAEQGTIAYLRKTLEFMEGPDRTAEERAVAQRILDALDKRKLRYFLSETPIPKGTSPLKTILQEFRTR